jgi:hypothetical protein
MDCAPVDSVEILPTTAIASMLPATAPSAPPQASLPGSLPEAGSMVVTTRHGSVLVPANFPRRESKDHRMHACMRPGEGGAMRLICIFLPPGM